MQEHEKTGGNAPIPDMLKDIADACGGTITEVSGPLSDGSGFAIMSMPLRDDHWIYDKGPTNFNVPPMPLRLGSDECVVIEIRQHNNVSRFRTFNCRELGQAIRDAGRYAVKTATMNGKEMDFDPDALTQNLIVGFLGYHTQDGLDHEDDWANPTKEWAPTRPTAPSDSLQPTAGAPNLYPPEK